MRQQPTAMPSASGYKVYQRLNAPIFVSDLVARFRQGTILSQITSDSIVPAEAKKYGTEVIWEREPEGNFHTYQENQELVHDDLETETFNFVIDKGVYWSLKLDKVTIKRTRDINKYVEAFKKNSLLKIERHAIRSIFLEIVYRASPHNKGTCAGYISGSVDLGVAGSPIRLTPKNIYTYLGLIKQVMQEQEIEAGSTFVVLPYEAQTVLTHPDSFLANACASGLGKSLILTSGEKFPEIAGFNFLFTNDVPRYLDPVLGKQTFAIVAGRREALAFITDMVVNRIVDNDPRSFGQYWQGLQIYGYKLLKPEEFAVLYAYFDYDLTGN